MRTVFALTIFAVICGVALAGEADTEVDVEHPVVPGLGSECFPLPVKNTNWRVRKVPKKFGGVCTTEAACPGDRQEHGYCGGIGVVCCLNPAPAVAEPVPWVEADAINPTSPNPATNSQMPVLKATTSACVTQRGTCGTRDQCAAKKGTLKTGLCPGTSICCFTTTAPAPTTPTTPSTATSLSALIKIPSGINAGLSMGSASVLIAKIGKPGCPLTAACFSCNCAVTNSLMLRNKVTRKVAPLVTITGLKPFVDAVERAFNAMKVAGASNPAIMNAYNSVKTAGGLCCRAIKRANGTPGSTWSNHSWGVAADFYFGANMDPRGDGKTQYGLALMAPFFAKEKLYWAAGYGGSQEDAMHFEASREVLSTWTF